MEMEGAGGGLHQGYAFNYDMTRDEAFEVMAVSPSNLSETSNQIFYILPPGVYYYITLSVLPYSVENAETNQNALDYSTCTAAAVSDTLLGYVEQHQRLLGIKCVRMHHHNICHHRVHHKYEYSSFNTIGS